MLARAASSIGTSGLGDSARSTYSSQEQIGTETEDQFSLGFFSNTTLRPNSERSAACRVLSNLEEEISPFGSNSARRGLSPSGLRSVLRGTATAPDLSTP